MGCALRSTALLQLILKIQKHDHLLLGIIVIVYGGGFVVGGCLGSKVCDKFNLNNNTIWIIMCFYLCDIMSGVIPTRDIGFFFFYFQYILMIACELDIL